MEKSYSIRNLSEKQIRTIEKALDAYTRIGIMQFETVVNDVFNWERMIMKNDKLSDSYRSNRDEIEAHLSEVRRLLVSNDETYKNYKGSNWSLGIGNEQLCEKTHIAYELQKDISISVFGDGKSKLIFTKETDSLVEEEDIRKEKILQIIKKYNEKK